VPDDPKARRLTFPGLYAAAETVSAERQRRFLLTRGAEYVALALAAGFGIMPNHLLGGVGPIVALALFVLALAIRVSKSGEDAEKRWYDARAAAESIKSSTWQFAVGGEAFRISDDAAASRFVESLKDVLTTLPKLDVGVQADSSYAVTPEMTALRSASQVDRAACYLSQRVKDQVGWYTRAAKDNKASASRWRLILISVEVSACILGLLRAMSLFDVDWLGFLAAAAAGIAAWQQTKNYSSLSEAYAVTSHEANLVATTVEQSMTEANWAQTVHDAEAAFSREHTLWLARRQGPRPH
jgi:hypothetical protein